MATVITNLLSAIPFIGGDLVPLSIILSLYLLYIYLIILNSSVNRFPLFSAGDKLIYNQLYIYISYISYIMPGYAGFNLQKEVIKYYLYFIINKLFKFHVLRDNTTPKMEYIENISYNICNIDRNLLALIVGFIDGDGYIRITKKSKDKTGESRYSLPKAGHINYIYMSLIINLNENDLELLQYFHQHLNIGKVYNITPKKGNKLARWEINKTDLLNKIEPLLDYHNINFLTQTRQKQYLLLKYIKHNKLVYYEDIIKYNKNINEYIENNIIYYNFNKLNYFNNWLVGFTMAEGSFLVKNNKEICFQLKQKYNLELFNNITYLFNTTRKLNIYKNKYIQFNVSSINDIQNIIKFFSFSNNLPLLGNKLISYNKWLLAIKNSNRYKELNIPYITN